MDKQVVLIDGKNCLDINSFYNEIDRVLTKGLNWQTGHNLDAFNDLLRGGFGVFDYEEPIKLIWTEFSNCKLKMGDDIMNDLIEIILSHNHIEFEMKG